MELLCLNSKIHECGVYQYGLRLFNIFKECPGYTIYYHEIDSYDEYNTCIRLYSNIRVIIYNYHDSTMSWLNKDVVSKSHVNIGIPHEVHPESYAIFNICWDINPLVDNGIPRPLLKLSTHDVNLHDNVQNFINYKISGSITIGSFGFGFADKGFMTLIQLVNNQYNNALIKLVIPRAHFDSSVHSHLQIAQKCKQLKIKPGIILHITHDFFTNDELLLFLGSNDINLFMYNYLPNRSISSVIDYALSVDTPFGISNSVMFRHIMNEKICVYDVNKDIPTDASINDCINNSKTVCKKYKDIFTSENVHKFLRQNTIYNYNYSQASQDLFSLILNNYKRNGVFVEIGSNDPIAHNNTYLMYKNYNWSGLMVEYDCSYKNAYDNIRARDKYILTDARFINYRKFLDNNNFPSVIDYLQIDLDVENRSTLDVLDAFDTSVFEKYKFATITFEHDAYLKDPYETRVNSRKIFEKHGYKLLFGDVLVEWHGNHCAFEDWYIHPDLIKCDLEPMHFTHHKQIIKKLLTTF